MFMMARSNLSGNLVLLTFLAQLSFGRTLLAADEQFFSGYIPTTTEEQAAFPITTRYRAFLPAAMDLRRHLPAPRDQKNLNSCVGWAVGYAARAYYVGKVEQENISKKTNIPSPAYIYHAIRDSKACEVGSKIVDRLRLL